MRRLLRRLRANPLDFDVGGGESVMDLLAVRLDESQPTVVDVGARNGFRALPQSFADHAELIGFEPNPAEHRKLVGRQTDAYLAGLVDVHYRQEAYHSFALWSETGDRPLYVTRGAGACTLMGEADPRTTARMYLGGEINYLEEHVHLSRMEMVPCRPLSEVIGEGKIVDLLKLDVEGAELPVLRGAEPLLDDGRILVIVSEFVLFPYYKTHPLLGDQQSYLAQRKYRTISIDLDHPPYRRSPSQIPMEGDRHMHFAGDAIYILDPDRLELGPERLFRMGTILLALRFLSAGVQLIRESGLVPAADMDRIEAACARKLTIRKLRDFWNGIPDRLRGGA